MARSKTAATSLQLLLRERRYLVYSVVSLAVAALLTVFVLIPRVQILLTAKDTLDQRTAEVDRMQKKAEFLNAFNTADFTRQNSTVNQILPSSKPFLQLLFSLQKLASDQGVALSGLQMNPGSLATQSAELATRATEQEIQSLPLEVVLLGDSDGIRKTIDKFALVAPVLDVESFSLSPKSGRDVAASTYEAKIKIQALYAPMKAVSAGVNIPARLTQAEEVFLSELNKYMLPPTQESELGDVAPAPAVGKDNPFAR